jgi:hypothetical protein
MYLELGKQVAKPEEKRPIGRPKHSRMYNMETELREVGWGDMDWINLAQNKDQWRALANTVTNFLVPYNFSEFLSSCTSGGLSRRVQLHEVSVMIFFCGYKISYKTTKCMVFQKELYNFESLYTFIQRTCTVL